MTREELINSDEYIAVYVEGVVTSNKSVKKMREELNKFFLDLKAELLSGIKPSSDTPPQLNKHDCYTTLPCDYWETRCALAEKCLEETPCDPDITSEQIAAWAEYKAYLKDIHGNSAKED
jgi:hypothetical protein